jgi:hypothetical protein
MPISDFDSHGSVHQPLDDNAPKHARGTTDQDDGYPSLAEHDDPSVPGQPPPVPVAADPGQPPQSMEAARPDHPALLFPSDFEDRWVIPAGVDVVSIDTGITAGRTGVGDLGAQHTVRQAVWGPQDPGGHRPDYLVDSGWAGPTAHVSAASVRGTAHYQYGDPRQDTYNLAVEGRWLIVVVADGVSEGDFSHLAADRAARTASNLVRQALSDQALGPDQIDWATISARTRSSVRTFAINVLKPSHKGVPTPDDKITDHQLAVHMSTTCELLVVDTEPDQDGVLAWWRVTLAGDGACYLLDPEQGWLAVDLSHDPDAHQINLAVIPFPEDAGVPEVLRGRAAPGQAVVVCTDGVGDLIGRGALPVGRYLHKQWREPCLPGAFLDTLNVVNVNGHDDRTAVVVWVTKEGIPT